MMLGPSGVGKTLMAKTLARVLEVPFSMSDCTPFTQAGYIGEDADVCITRLLSAANWDVTRAERGIVCLDEIDKIAMARVSHGKDVSGEGVQQALLKIVEGTTVQVTAKQERNAQGGQGPGPGPGPGRGGSSLGQPMNNPSSSGPLGGGPTNPAQGNSNKGDVYNVRTDNILFICTGAFIGLHKMILDRISKGSIGFGAPVRSSSGETSDTHDTMLVGEDELFRKHLPFYTPPHEPSPSANFPSSPQPISPHTTTAPPSLATRSPPPQSSSSVSPPSHQRSYNTLDLVTPPDLQRYGLIPELIGRIPVTCAVAPLDHESLVRVLTEPRNSLLRQFEQLFALSGAELRFTSAALWEMAGQAREMGTGARGLRTVMERVVGEGMFDVPGMI